MSKNTKFVTIVNTSKQMIPLQVKQPGADFYVAERQVRIRPGKQVQLPADYLMDAQLENLRSRKDIQVIK